MPHYVIHAKFPDESAPCQLGWLLLANDQAEAEAKAAARLPSAESVHVSPARAFEDAPRYRESGKRIPIAYVEATREARGLEAGPVATVYLNESGSRTISPARLKLVEDMLAFLNTEAPAHPALAATDEGPTGPWIMGEHVEIATLQTGGPIVVIDGKYVIVDVIDGGFYLLWGDHDSYCDGSTAEGEAEFPTLEAAREGLAKAKAAADLDKHPEPETMGVFRVDVALCGTAYVVAANRAEAVAKLKDRCGPMLEATVPDSCSFGDVPVEDGEYSYLLTDPEAPDVSLSPALTFYGASDHIKEAEFRAEALELIEEA